jgi:uncharacterized protein YodC (DUF2158 family)
LICDENGRMFSVTNGTKSLLYEGRWRNGVYKKTEHFDEVQGKNNLNVPGNVGGKRGSRQSALMMGSE